ncbi:MAG: acetyl-CoA synthase subunit gamma [Acidobacteria bacterium]|jgi:acetyl-CoA decarbonylase/synthase complex subunit gamma|nr:acetyl-CoA synthase subunit gamma [Acidobacteriota bacterium]
MKSETKKTGKMKEKSCCASTSCCSPRKEVILQQDIKGEFIMGWTDSKIGKIPRVSTQLSPSDKWGTLKVRLAFRRKKYKVDPGLYAVGNPDPGSIVLVTANYKLSFDHLRRELKDINAWILVLDTKGINVWCAAGKGTFGTGELVKRIEASGLKQVVDHRRLIVPQLGAVGVSAHQVRKLSGFSVIYGPVRASDLPAFLESNMKASPGMRRVRFAFFDRLKIVPVEMVLGTRYLVVISAAFFLLSGLSRSGYTFHWEAGLVSVLNLVIAYLAGTLIGPALLPWLPGRSFSIKGAAAGLLAFLVLFLGKLTGGHFLQVMAWLLLIPAFSSFLTMNFTGASTYTSLSGVKKEMRIALPIQISAAAVGLVLWISGRFI